jgi:hypothetical protein
MVDLPSYSGVGVQAAGPSRKKVWITLQLYYISSRMVKTFSRIRCKKTIAVWPDGDNPADGFLQNKAKRATFSPSVRLRQPFSRRREK